MTKMYHPSTPIANRLREGLFGEAILPPKGVLAGPVYVYDAAVRIWHWVTAHLHRRAGRHGLLHRHAAALPGRRGGRPLPVRLDPLRALLGRHDPGRDVPACGSTARSWAAHTRGRSSTSRSGASRGGRTCSRRSAGTCSSRSRRSTSDTTRWRTSPCSSCSCCRCIVLLLTGFAMFAEGAGYDGWYYGAFGWVLRLLGDSMTVHTVHHAACGSWSSSRWCTCTWPSART